MRTKRLTIDGALGSLLQKRVDSLGEVPEEHGIVNAEIIQGIHREYVAAGADIILAATFGLNRYRLHQTQYSQRELVAAAVANAKAANPAYVALDVGPIGALIGALGEISFADAVDSFKELIELGVEYGVDLIVIETMTDIGEARAALLAAKECCDLPVIVSLTYENNGRTMTGTDPLTAVTILEGLGADAVGLNCSTGPDKMLPVIEEITKYATVPVFVEPNAGLPSLVGGETVYDIDAEAFAGYMAKIAGLGATILGGCCGTTPAHIAATAQATVDLPFVDNSGRKKMTRVASATRTVALGEDIVVIGESINPTANKALKEDLRQGKLDLVQELALKQTADGAGVLDVNLGLPEIDEAAMMKKAVAAITQLTDLPLSIDSSDPAVIEGALREYNGVAIINSVNGEQKSMDAILPLAKKYGACVLGLTMDERGIPESTQQRLEIVDKILAGGASYGIAPEKFLFDCLVLTASAQQAGVLQTLAAVKAVHERGFPTALGASNISFGLPYRSLINKTFLVMAMHSGLNTPITNPSNQEMMDAIAAYRVLSGLDDKCQDYLRDYADRVDVAKSVTKRETSQKEENDTAKLIDYVIKGQAQEAAGETTQLLKNTEPLDIVNNYLIPALDIVGDRFETGEAFLPNLIFAAEAVQAAFAVIKEEMGEGETVKKGTIILATVEGDVHDIGKNILKVILENYGYEIIDLGKDVPAAEIIAAVQKNKVKLVGLSALMTTTVKNMEGAIAEIHAACPDTQVMVGGAVLNPEYAQTINADFYGGDAKAGVNIAKTVFSDKSN